MNEIAIMPDDQKPDDKKLRVPPPPRKTRGIIADAPKPNEAPTNLAKSNTGLQDMNFKMDSDFHHGFKMIATKYKMAMKEFLEASVRSWVDTHGDDEDKRWIPPNKPQG